MKGIILAGGIGKDFSLTKSVLNYRLLVISHSFVFLSSLGIKDILIIMRKISAYKNLADGSQLEQNFLKSIQTKRYI